jgi:hypothetical protein
MHRTEGTNARLLRCGASLSVSSANVDCDLISTTLLLLMVITMVSVASRQRSSSIGQVVTRSQFSNSGI